MGDMFGNMKSRDKIALIKIAIPDLCFKVIDCAIQIFGGAGVSDDFPLAYALTSIRCLRIADGPDEVHRRTLAKFEIKKTMINHVCSILYIYIFMVFFLSSSLIVW